MRLPELWNTDRLFSKVRSLHSNICAQVMTNGNYVKAKLLMLKKHHSQILTGMAEDIGILDKVISDRAPEI